MSSARGTQTQYLECHTLAGSSPTTVGVHPIPVLNAKLVNALTTLVFPELGGPTTMTLGPHVMPSSFVTPLGYRRASILWRSRARWMETSWGCVVELEEYCEVGKAVTVSQLRHKNPGR
jgi:hypothetical protein